MKNDDMLSKFPPLTSCRHIIHGGDYNPDQWLSSPDVPERDVELMRLAHINSATVAIFAWSAIEPEEGVYNFGWLDDTIERLYNNGIGVVLSTPSGARPAWLDIAHPEIMRTSANGVRIRHGRRQNHCYTSPYYRKKTAEIDGKLSERYGRHPGVILWHISNEYSGECYCELCRAEFRNFLKERYHGDIEELNHMWWTGFWSHRYRNFDEIDPPYSNGENSVHGLNIDWKRFVTRQTAAFMRNEAEALRMHSDIPITTNLMGTYEGLDYRVLAKEADLVSWDNYPRWHEYGVPESDTAVTAAFSHDLMRCVDPEKKPFLLMESTPSLVNWMPVNKLKRPGMHILSSLHAVAHGADSVQYFQFRKSRGAAEKFHGAVVDHEGSENTRVFAEVKRLGEMLEGLDEIVGTRTVSRVALLYDWDNRWAIEDFQGLTQNRKYPETCIDHYSYFCKMGINVDIIGRNDSFEGYDLIIAPMLYMVGDGEGEKYRRYVRDGGTIVATYLLSYVNQSDLCHLGGFPGEGLRELFGIWNEEADSLYPGEKVLAHYKSGNDLGLKGRFELSDICELIHSEGAEVIAEYDTEFYSGMPVVTVNRYGKGKAYYIAARCSRGETEEFYRALSGTLGIDPPLPDLPDGVHAAVRSDADNDYVFVMNFNRTPAETDISGYDMIVSERCSCGDKMRLEPFGTAVLRKNK